MRALSWLAGVVITATFFIGIAYIEVTAQKIAKPEFVPGQRVIIKVGSWTIEGTVDEPRQRVNRAAKGDKKPKNMYTGPYLGWDSTII